MTYMIRSSNHFSREEVLKVKYLVAKGLPIKDEFPDFDEMIDEVATNTGETIRVLYFYPESDTHTHCCVCQFKL